MKKTNKKGFTIVELVIVIAVIAILAGVLIPTFGGIVETANENKALQEVKNAYTATLANDISDNENEDVVYGQTVDIFVEHDNGTIIQIKVGGEAVVAADGATAGYELAEAEDGGKIIVAK